MILESVYSYESNIMLSLLDNNIVLVYGYQ